MAQSRWILSGMILLCVLQPCAAFQDQGQDAPFGLQHRVAWTTSRIEGTPDPPPPYTVERVFEKLVLEKPVFIAAEPGSDRLIVAELNGNLRAFSSADIHVSEPQEFLTTNRQIYSFSFHPDYVNNGVVFVFSPTGKDEGPSKKLSRVSRFRASIGGDGFARCDPASEEIIIEWPSGGHNGGEAIIGPDGYLYVSTGDGTSGSDPNETGQGVNDLFSVVMRLDVSKKESNRNYAIPSDNPFINTEGARPEVWAHGFRNPWRMSFDPVTKYLWVGDVGQDLWEMIWVVKKGGNYGWSLQEGSHPFHPHKPKGPGPIQPPVVEHHHTECRSITGGYVYHGAKFPELHNVYFYGDYEYGKVWGVKFDGTATTWKQELADTPLRIPSFGVGHNGEILIMDHPSGELYQLVRAPTRDSSVKFPRRLSETGLFKSVEKLDVASGVIPYSVNQPQWCDGAVKKRWVALPGDSKIGFVEKSTDAKTWGFADGTVTAETLSIQTNLDSPNVMRRIETRIMVKQESHWLGYSYLWNKDQTDATLVDALGQELTLKIRDQNAPGGERTQKWRVPSRSECMVCHSRAAGFVLGLNTIQINRAHDYGAVSDNQIRTFNHLGLFEKPLEKEPSELDSIPRTEDDEASVVQRARGYLHVNCSVCHVADGGGNAKIQLRYDLDDSKTNLVDAQPIQGDFGLSDGKIVRSGDPYGSVLFYRLAKRGPGRMPHVGSELTHQHGLELIHDWISSLDETRSKLNEGHARDIVKILLKAQPDDLQALVQAHTERTSRALELSWILATTPELSSLRQPISAIAMKSGRAEVRDLFERFVPPAQRVQRLGERFDPQDVLTLAGDPVHGKKLFFGAASQCQNCHQVKGRGDVLGPDLSEIGKKYSTAELLDSLASPSSRIEDKYRAFLVALKNGTSITGLIVERGKERIVLQTYESGKAKNKSLEVGDIEELVPQKKSLMPDLMLRDFTAQQASDLIAYLKSLH